jgi:8-oxo-dGTP pyrophosphatase MutT (NUDIX family)
MNSYVESMRSRIGHDTLMLVGAGVFIHKDGKILLQRRKDNGMWADHGGSLEIGESAEEAAKRELFEETGLIANKLDFFGVYSGKDTLGMYPNGDKVFFVLTFWTCDDFSGKLNPNPEEVLELKWFDINALPPIEQIGKMVRKSILDFAETCKLRQTI